jgi:hypothetical protein
MSDELCPSCGAFETIVEVSGWCLACTQDYYPDLHFCIECHTPVPTYHNHKLCSQCKAEKWLSQHADEIEVYMMVGWSFSAAKQQVIKDIRPVCVNCEGPINGGNADAIFCTARKECRTTQRRYRLFKDKGMDRDAAIRQAIKVGRRNNERSSASA